MQRVEVEALVEARSLVEPLVESLGSACALQPAQVSKYEYGLSRRASSGPRREPSAHGDRAPDTIGEVALAILRRHFATMLAKEPGTRVGDDVEELHDMRVATRRMRAALSLFADALPAAAAELRPELAWVGQEIGVVRDLDVQLQQLDGWLEALPRRIALRSRRFARCSSRTASRRGGRCWRRSTRPATSASCAGDDAGRAAGRRRRRSPSLPTSSRPAPRRAESGPPHRARRRAARLPPPPHPGKRFRYALEFLADVYPGATTKLVRRTVAVQDLLGAYQDGDVAIARLRGLAAERGVELGPATVFAMGEVAGATGGGWRTSASRCRRRSRSSRGRNGRLRRRMEEARPPAPVPRPPPAP